eukprot:TRINITY_DN31826_c0_g1_i1.p1 TRINITY_DN31826_c0_g1~~TRINITY_DN31826_c0_g1_i1.p1  ORF type:complete len:315 (-),score=41.91 TRINITY_DN31826_c0_g1_i1:112-1056(-)
MSKQELPTTAVVDKEGTGSLNISLHPLVIINISDHWTRTKVQNNTPNPRVIGAFVGVQAGRNVEICNSFELVHNEVDGVVVIDPKYLQEKSEQFKKVYKNYDFLGWYSTGQSVQLADIEVHKQFFDINESPLYLLLDPVACSSPATKDLPIFLYESELHMVSEQPTLLFVKAPYKIETNDSERISVDHIARATTTAGSSASQLTTHLSGMHNSIQMLSIRVQVILKYLQAVKDGQIPADNGVLRRIGSLCYQLPSTDTAEFKQEFLNEYNDALLVSYLATLTKGSNIMNDLVEKFNITHDRFGGPGLRGARRYM